MKFGTESMEAGRPPIGAPPPSVHEVLYRISQGTPFVTGSVSRAFLDLVALTDETARGNLLTAVLTGIMARGPGEDDIVEVLIAALSLDDAETVELASPPGSRLLLLAGSGKKGIKSFNVSTSSAIVAASVGASVVKMGSRATSSMMGSRDLADSLGLPKSHSKAEIDSAIRGEGLAFVPLEDMIPTLDGLYGGRFHVLNPFSFGLAGVAARLRGGVHVYGLAHPKVELAARVLSRLGVREALVLGSGDALGYYSDELGLGDRSLICELRDGKVGPVSIHRNHELDFASAGAVRIRPPSSTEEAVRWVLDALTGEGNPAHIHLVALNAAVMLTAARLAQDLSSGYEQAWTAIRTGRAAAKLEALRKGCAVSADGVDEGRRRLDAASRLLPYGYVRSVGPERFTAIEDGGVVWRPGIPPRGADDAFTRSDDATLTDPRSARDQDRPSG